MTINELHYDFKLKQNRVDALTNRDFNSAEIDWLLNEAQLIFIKQRFGTSNKSRKGFETTKKRIEDLSSLVIKYPLQPALTQVSLTDAIEVRLSELEYPHLFIVSAYVNGKVDGCEMEIPLKFIQHDDYRQALRDPFNSPSSEFIPFNLGVSTDNNGVSMYIYNGSVTITNVVIEYIKYPTRASLGTYPYIDGVIYPAKTLELPSQTHSEVVDIAVSLAATASQIPEFLQLNNYKLQTNE